jgi:hypothetical protein
MLLTIKGILSVIGIGEARSEGYRAPRCGAYRPAATPL